jgi:hypothetical protein
MITVSPSTTHNDLIGTLVRVDAALSGADLELRLCMVVLLFPSSPSFLLKW